MPIVTAGTSIPITLPPGQKILVANGGDGIATVGNGGSPRDLGDGPAAIGPYQQTQVVLIQATRDLSYEVVDASASTGTAGGSSTLGPYTDLAALQADKPAAGNAGRTATAGGVVYNSNGSQWQPLSGVTLSTIYSEGRAGRALPRGTKVLDPVTGRVIGDVGGQQPIVSASGRSRINHSSTAPGSGTTTVSRCVHRTAVAISNPWFELMNGYVQTTGAAANPETGGSSNPGTRFRAAILTGVSGSALNQSNATVWRLSFFGMLQDAAFIAAGGTVSADGSECVVPNGWVVRTDPAWGLSIKAGEVYFSHVDAKQSNQGTSFSRLTRNVYTNTAIGDHIANYGFDVEGTVGGQLAVYQNNWTGIVASSGSVLVAPVFVFGASTPGTRCIAVDGDSLMSGRTADIPDSDGVVAVVHRALNSLGYSMMSTAVSGTSIGQLTRPTTEGLGGVPGYLRYYALNFAEVVITDMGTNDQYGVSDIDAVSTNSTSNGLRTLYKFHNDFLRSRIMPGGRVARLTWSPQSNSSDSWLTVGNQTPKTIDSTFPTGNRFVMNDYMMRRGSYASIPRGGAGEPDVVYDWAAIFANTTNGLFKADGATANLWTPDGAHFSTTATEAAVTTIQAAVPSLIGQPLAVAVSAGGAVSSVAGKTGAVTLAASDVGLGNVDNVAASALRDRSTHTGTQSADTIVDGTTNRVFTSAEKVKLAGLSAGGGGGSSSSSTVKAVYRGFNLGSLQSPALKEYDFYEMAAYGANIARVAATPSFSGDSLTLSAGDLAYLDLAVASGTKYGFKVCIVLAAQPEGQAATFWGSTAQQNAIISVWQQLATRYLGNPTIYGFDLLNEPVIPQDRLPTPGTPTGDVWRPFAINIITAIRAIDPNVACIFEPSRFAAPAGMWPGGQPYTLLPFPNIIYSIHFYDPRDVSHQGIDGGTTANTVSYPDGTYNHSRAILDDYIDGYVKPFALANPTVRIYVGEFSCTRFSPGNTADNLVSDMITKFEQYGWDWSYHSYRETYDGWDAEVAGNGASAGRSNTAPVIQTLKTAFSRNKVDVANVPSGSNSGSTVLSVASRNLTLANTSRIRAAIAAARAGGPPAVIAKVGDSTTLGAGAGTSTGGSTTGLAGARPNAPTQQVTALVNAKGAIVASNRSIFGAGYSDTTSLSTYDTRITLGAGWTLPAGVGTDSLGGQQFLSSSTNPLTFVVTGTVDRVRVFASRFPGNGNFNVVVNGTSRGTISTTIGSGDGFAQDTVSFAAVTGATITLVPASSTAVYVAGIEAWNSATDKLLLRQFAQWGKSAAEFVNATMSWSPLNSHAVYQNHLTILSLTINDATAGTDKTLYQSRLESLVQRMLLAGSDVILELGATSGNTASTDGKLYAIQAATAEVANAYNLPLLSVPALFGGYTAANGKGWMFDTLHPNTTGYAQIAAMEASVVDWLQANS